MKICPGSCNQVIHQVQRRDVHCSQWVSKENDVKVIVAELLEYKIICACVYLSPDSDFNVL
jgi:hypothetical protein